MDLSKNKPSLYPQYNDVLEYKETLFGILKLLFYNVGIP